MGSPPNAEMYFWIHWSANLSVKFHWDTSKSKARYTHGPAGPSYQHRPLLLPFQAKIQSQWLCTIVAVIRNSNHFQYAPVIHADEYDRFSESNRAFCNSGAIVPRASISHVPNDEMSKVYSDVLPNSKPPWMMVWERNVNKAFFIHLHRSTVWKSTIKFIHRSVHTHSKNR